MNTKDHGIVTDFKRFAVHDGDGIRTTVFLKGCPLHCEWCHNPEGISCAPQLALYTEKCVSCGKCARVCTVGAHSFDGGVHLIDRAKCVGCGKCESVCINGALKLYGRDMTVDEVIEIVAEDKLFYAASGGGMTLSGGEPTLQPEFALALLISAKERGISTALDTCGFAPREIYSALLPYTDKFLYDVKHIAEEEHIAGTGRSNQLILENLRFLSDSGAKIEIRIPFIPSYNSGDITIAGIGEMLAGIRTTRVKLLAYHSMARSKYASLGMTDTMPPADSPSKPDLEAAASILRGYGLNVVIE